MNSLKFRARALTKILAYLVILMVMLAGSITMAFTCFYAWSALDQVQVFTLTGFNPVNLFLALMGAMLCCAGLVASTIGALMTVFMAAPHFVRKANHTLDELFKGSSIMRYAR